MEYEFEKDKEIDLVEYWRTIVRRKGIIFIFTCAIVLLVGLYSFTVTPKYKATATLLIEEESSKIMSIDNEFGYGGRFSDLRFFNTQLILLKSESLTERVARKMDLLSHPEFRADRKDKKNLLAKIKDVFTLRWLIPKRDSNREASEEFILKDPYLDIVDTVQDRLKVTPIRETKAVKVSCTFSSAVLAAELVNTLAQEFISFSIEKRYETTQQATDFLSEQIADLRDDLAEKEREIQRYGQETELYYLNDSESIAVNKFADLNEAYTEAQIDRIKKEAAFRELRNLNADSLPPFVNNSVIQKLKTDYTAMKNEYEEKSKLYKSDYPDMIQLMAKINSMKDELKSEIKKAVDMAQSDYQSAVKNESSINQLLEEQRGLVAKMDSSAIYYNSLKIEVENKRKLLGSLVERQNQTLVSARLGGLKKSYISIIDKAKIGDKPVFPKKELNLILALLFGVFGGVILCFFVEYLDNTVKGPEDVERLVHLPSLGVIPLLIPDGKKKKTRYEYYSKGENSSILDNQGSEKKEQDIKEIELISHFHPKSIISEDYRTVRTSILLSCAEKPPKTIVFSSALPSEGKSATVANLAISFSQLHEKVLVVDADLRKSRLHKIFNIRNSGGLTGYLTGRISDENVVQKTSIENVWLIPSGPSPPDPSELLNSKEMRLLLERQKNEMDIILIDTPPVLAVTDSIIVSSFAEGVVLIVQPEKTVQEPFLKAIEELKRNKANILGVLFNQAKLKNSYYFNKYNYYKYRDYYD